jgi:hypothetical protein
MAPPPCTEHLRDLPAHAQPHALDVDRHHAVVQRLVGFGELEVFFLDARVVEGAVDAPEARQRGGHHVVDLLRTRHVGAHEQRAAAAGLDLLRECGAGLGVDVDQHQLRAGTRERERGAAADAAGGAGDQRGESGEGGFVHGRLQQG